MKFYFFIFIIFTFLEILFTNTSNIKKLKQNHRHKNHKKFNREIQEYDHDTLISKNNQNNNLSTDNISFSNESKVIFFILFRMFQNILIII